MSKDEFIEKLKKHAASVGIFEGRFVCLSNDENYWKYERPAIDVLEPSIDLSKDGIVLFSRNIDFCENIIEEISYDDFITKYKLI